MDGAHSNITVYLAQRIVLEEMANRRTYSVLSATQKTLSGEMDPDFIRRATTSQYAINEQLATLLASGTRKKNTCYYLLWYCIGYRYYASVTDSWSTFSRTSYLCHRDW